MVMMMPEIPFTQRKARALNLARNAPAIPLKKSHHRLEPMNTPSTNIAAEP